MVTTRRQKQKKFHAFAQQKWVVKSIFQIMDSKLGNILTNAQQIRDEGVNFFQNLLALVDHPAPFPLQVEDFIQHIPTMISPMENTKLVAPFTIQEILRSSLLIPPG